RVHPANARGETESRRHRNHGTIPPYYRRCRSASRSAYVAPSCGEALVDLSDRQSFLPRPADDVAGIAEAAECELPLGYVGKRTIESVFRQIEPAELVREQFEPDIGVDLRLQEMV